MRFRDEPRGSHLLLLGVIVLLTLLFLAYFGWKTFEMFAHWHAATTTARPSEMSD